jgi:hypothetical protein
MSTLTGEVAPKGATCPTCGLDVGGYAIGRTVDGRTTWDRPTYPTVAQSGRLVFFGGLTHVEGGERCEPSEGLVIA